jgi:protein-tyrosine phosphatase
VSEEVGQRRQRSILFLCTGNYYRSRYAEIVFNAVAGQQGLPWQASSRGLALERGVHNVGPMATAAVTALEALGIQATEAWTRLPASATSADLASADRIIALKADEHLPLLRERFPAWVAKVECWHIDDAAGVLPLIEHAVAALAARLGEESR